MFGLALVLASGVPGCSRRSAESGPSDRLRIGLNINPTVLDPIFTQNTIEEFVAGLMFDQLVTQNDRHEQVPDLAAIVPTLANGGISKDGLTITYRLRHDVKWQDGVPFTSRDVAFTWRTIVDPNENVVSRRGYDQIASIDTPDDYTVVMHMKRIFPPAIDTIFGEGDTPYGVLPAHLLAKYRSLNQVPFNAAPVGTGPFRFGRWLRNDRILMTANDAYFRGAPKIKQLTLLVVLDSNTTAAELRTHELDLALEISGPTYRNLADAPGIVRQLAPAPSYTALIFNTRRPPFDDVRVRRALVIAADRAGITRDDTYGTARPAVADLGPYYWAFDASLKALPYDPAAAAALLDAAGWRRGRDGIREKNGVRLSLQLAYGEGSDVSRAVTVQAQSMWRSVGVEILPKGYEFATLYATAENGGIFNGGKFDVGVYSWVAGADPDNSSQWGCAAIPPAGNNVTRYCSAEMDAAQRRALSTFDRTVRKRAYSRIEALLVRDAPAAFVWYASLRYAKIPELSNFAPNGITESWNAQEWSR